jgi:hypothetical protein
MTWLKVCDTALTHPKVLAIRGLRHEIATGEAVIGTVMLAASWSGAHDTDYFIADAAVMIASPAHHELMADVARRVGLWTPANGTVRRRNNGQAGWIVKVGEGEVFHLLTREQKATQAAHRKLGRSVQGRIDLHLRDGDQCRYCAGPVEPNDRKSHLGRTFDHPNPAIKDELVVACRGCNLSKAKRTVDQWVAAGGRPLLLTPAERGDPLYLDGATREWLTKYNALPGDSLTSARPGTQPGDAATERPAADQARAQLPSATPVSPSAATQQPTRSDPDPIPAGVAGHAVPGRVGTGRVGSHSGDPPLKRTRTRGTRGKRGRGAPPPS